MNKMDTIVNDAVSDTKAVILINPASTGLNLINAAKKNGLKPIAAYTFSFKNWISFQETGQLTCPDYASFQELIEEIIFSEQLDDLIVKIKNLPYEIVGVIPASEHGVNVSDIIASRLRLICNPPHTIPLRRNKLDMKIAARKHGLKTADFKLCFDESDLHEFMLTHSFPFVLKTPEGMGTRDIYVCRYPEKAIDSFNKIFLSQGILGHKAQGVLAESFVEGDEYAVNLFVYGDQVKVTDVWKYHKINNQHGENIYHSDLMIAEPETYCPDLLNYAKKLTQAVGIVIGAVHAEIKLSNNHEPVMIEIASRLAGGHQPQLAAAFSNFNSIEATIAAYTGMSVNLPEKISFIKHCAIVNGINYNKGVIRNICGIEDIKQLASYHRHSLTANIGDEVDVTVNLGGTFLMVELAHQSSEQVRLDIESVHQLFRFEMHD